MLSGPRRPPQPAVAGPAAVACALGRRSTGTTPHCSGDPGARAAGPLTLSQASAASFAADEVWSTQPLAALRREIWSGWVRPAAPTRLDDNEPAELRRLLDGAAKRADDRRGRDRGQAEDFLRALREEP